MANSNVNIASKLYAYIKHGVDIDNNIKQIYYNSMIFIGDEQQIYVPVMDTYVGIGMTAYNNTLDRITRLEESFNEVTDKLSQNVVSTVFANYSWRDLSYNAYINSGDIVDQQFNGNGSEPWEFHNEITFRGINDYDPTTGFARKIDNPYIIKDAENREYTLDNTASSITSGPLSGQVVDNQHVFNASALYSDKALPTSGITVTPHWGETENVFNPITGQVMPQRMGNYITIDDTLTWSYMTSAYAYTLNYSTNYVNSEIERVYHNLLGDAEGSYVMASFGSIVEDIADQYNKLSADEQEEYQNNHPGFIIVNNGDVVYDPNNSEVAIGYSHVYKVKDGNYFYFAYNTENYENASETDGTGIYYPITGQDIADLLDSDNTNNPSLIINDNDLGQFDKYINYVPASEVDYLPVGQGFPQLYVYDTQYNSSYNMNIKDGIETLKEVAYLLDLLTDSQLGSVTYYTYAQVSDDDPASEFNTQSAISGNIVYWISDDPAWHPIDTDTYAYIVNTGNPENLGIQIAYSIAGNKVQIDDLHSHTDLMEEGKTTLRSIQSTNTNFVNIDLIGGTTEWVDTDSKQGMSNFGDESNSNHPNRLTENKNAQNSYLVGDVNIKVSLNTATTYTTSYTTGATAGQNIKYVDEYNVLWFGSYTPADMENLPETFVQDTYFIIGNGDLYDDSNATVSDIDDAHHAVFTAVDSTQYAKDVKGGRYQDSGTQYYWKPNAASALNNDLQNLKYKSYTVSEYLSMTATDEVVTDITKAGDYSIFIKDTNGIYREFSAPTPGTTSSVDAFVAAFGNTNNMNQINQQFGLSEENLTLDSTIYIIDPSQIEEVVVHPVIGGDNALATTEWTNVFVDAKVEELKTDLDNILESAKQYTRKKIDELDLNYKYSDFAEYWENYFDSLDASDPIKVIGSAAYNNAYDLEKEKYETFTNDNGYSVYTYAGSDNYRLTYQLESQYAYNTVEENGIVKVETRELPSDELSAKYRIWGDEQNGLGTKAHVYADVVLAGAQGEDTDKAKDVLYDANEGLIMRLYKWFSSAEGLSTPEFGDDKFENQLFVADGLTYQPVPFETEATANFVDLSVGDIIDNEFIFSATGKSNLYYLSNPESNEYSTLGDYLSNLSDSLVAVHGNSVTEFDYNNPADKYWKQLYVRVPKYVEIDLQKAEDTGTSADRTRNSVNIKIDDTDFYTLTATTPGTQNTTVTVTKNSDANFSETLKYISTKARAEKRYLTVENKHYSYVDNGNGENKFEITAHITSIEDASEINSGFADAFDVQTYVKNFFSWVDVSASVTNDIVNSSDKYYKVITFAEYDEMTTKPELYIRKTSGNTVEYGNGTLTTGKGTAAVASNGTPTTGWYWCDDNTFAGNIEGVDFANGTMAGGGALSSEVHGAHIMVDGKWFHQEFRAATGSYDPIESNYYIRIEEPKINPLNLAETQYK